MNKTVLFVAFMVINTCITAQVYNKDRHNTNYNAAWISCNTSQNPNSDRGTGHWINYDLRRSYDIFELSFWNLNDPSKLDDGLQDVVIDVSLNGTEWTEAGIFTIPRSDGSAYYNGIKGLNLNGTSARYLLVTAINNYGGTCYGLSEVKIEVAESVLPVTLIDFKAQCNEDGIVSISWDVELEYNNESYTCQSSLDGKSWIDIATIKGKNLKQKNTYRVTDKPMLSDNIFYRVMQKDFDGSTSYFPVIQARCNSFENELRIYPNPASNMAIITFSSNGDQQPLYRLTDIGGKVLIIGNLSGNETEVDMSQLSPGTYFITISDDKATFQKKIIKI